MWGGYEKLSITYSRQVLCKAAILSAVFFGIALIRGRVRDQRPMGARPT